MALYGDMFNILKATIYWTLSLLHWDKLLVIAANRHMSRNKVSEMAEKHDVIVDEVIELLSLFAP